MSLQEIRAFKFSVSFKLRVRMLELQLFKWKNSSLMRTSQTEN